MAYSRSINRTPFVWLAALAVGAVAGCLGSSADGDSEDLCGCFETNGVDSFSVSCSFAEDYGNCGTYEVLEEHECPDSQGDCIPPDLEASNAPVVQCILERFASGEPGTFKFHTSEYSGQNRLTDHYVLTDEGTVLAWSYDLEDLNTVVSAVQHRQAPTAAALEDCEASSEAHDQWRCIEAAVAGAPVIETCTDDLLWTDY
ncbi:MAG: hypothetical protein AAF799_35355 [Myxococcota bacterium]